MTTDYAIKVIKYTNETLFGGQLKSLDMAVADMAFLDFLVNVIPPNEMEKYREMYKCSDYKNNC